MTRDISSSSRTYKRLRGFALGVALLLAMSCGGPPTGSVILVVVDTLRADHLGLYGYARPTSPNLDAWAKDGRVFDHAFAPAPWTLPSFASIYTGHWPLIHQGGRIVRLVGDRDTQAPVEYLPALAEILQTEGFQTMAVVNNSYLAPSFGMARGFDVYDLDPPKAGPNPHRSAANTIQRAFELIDAVAEQPFFLVIHLFEPHLTYSAPPPFRGSFTAAVAGSNFTLPITKLRGLGVDESSAEDQAFIIAAYDEEIAYTDQQLGVLRDGSRPGPARGRPGHLYGGPRRGTVRARGLRTRTRAVAGTVACASYLMGRGCHPGRDATPVSLVDIAPTVLDWLDLVSPVPFDGVSLLPTVSANVQVPDRPLYAGGVTQSTPKSAVMRWPHKLVIVHTSGRLLRFDLRRTRTNATSSLAIPEPWSPTSAAINCGHVTVSRRPPRPARRSPSDCGHSAICAGPRRRPRSWRTASTLVIPMKARVFSSMSAGRIRSTRTSARRLSSPWGWCAMTLWGDDVAVSAA